MAAFTTISDGMDWSHIDVYNELALAYTERKSASNAAGSALRSAEAGDDATDIAPGSGAGGLKVSWAYLQSQLQAIAPYFVNHTINGGSFQDEATIPLFTVALWRAEAGIHEDGYRRATAWDPDNDDWTDINDGMFEYGPAEEGDIVGPWILDDLQKGLSALKWSKTGASSSPISPELRRGIETNATCANALAITKAEYAADTYTAAPVGNFFYEAQAGLSGTYTANTHRRRAKSASTAPDATLKAAVDVYCYIQSSGVPKANIDGLTIALDTFAFHEEIASAAGAARYTVTFFPGIDTDPLIVTGTSCPGPAFANTYTQVPPTHVYKWEFTNSN